MSASGYGVSYQALAGALVRTKQGNYAAIRELVFWPRAAASCLEARRLSCRAPSWSCLEARLPPQRGFAGRNARGRHPAASCLHCVGHCAKPSLLDAAVSMAAIERGEVSLHQVFVARLPSASEKQPQRPESLTQIFPDTSTQALGERTVCIEPARSTRV